MRLLLSALLLLAFQSIRQPQPEEPQKNQPKDETKKASPNDPPKAPAVDQKGSPDAGTKQGKQEKP